MTDLLLEIGSKVAVIPPLQKRLHLWKQRRRAVEEGKAHPLAQAQVGQTLRIVGIAGEHELDVCDCFDCSCSMSRNSRRRILEMGLIPGTRVTLMSKGDPIIVQLWGGRTALSRSLACGIFVVPESSLQASPLTSERAA